MTKFPDADDRIRWINVPIKCEERGDEFGTFKYRDGEYLYCLMDGSKSIVELYRCEIEILIPL